MKSMKKAFILLLTGILVLSLVGCGNNASPSSSTGTSTSKAAESAQDANSTSDEKIVITFAGTTAETHPLALGAYAFKEYMEKNSDGRVEVNLHLNGQLGSGRELAEAVQAGTITLCDNSISSYANFTDKYLGLSLPFMFTSNGILKKFLDSDVLEQLNQEVAGDTNIYAAAFCFNGTRSLSSSKSAVVSPADLKNQKIRVMESPMYIKMFEAMGASPIPMAYSELYTGMQQGTIDGQDNPPVTFYTNAFYEVQKYFTYLGHTRDISVCMSNQEWYLALPDDIREMFDAGMIVYRDTVNVGMDDMEGSALEDLKGVIDVTILNDEQIAEFKESCAPVYEWYEKEYTDSYLDAIRAEVDSIAASI